jgi:endonuclease YncB( thermonuclease family)
MQNAPFCHMAVAIMLILRAHAASAEEPESLSGRASVIDGDTIQIRDRHIRLFGMDAPETVQTCEANGRPYRCGEAAAHALADRIHDRTVSCQWRDIDGYEQLMAVCTAGGEDLGRFMVRAGWAIASRRYAPGYVDDELTAKSARAGLWRGRFVPPWKWRLGYR